MKVITCDICDEIFGKKSFIAQLVWRSDGNFDNQAKIKNCHEYILCYIKKPDMLGLPNGVDPSASENSKVIKNEIRNTVVKNGPKNPMSRILLPKEISQGIFRLFSLFSVLSAPKNHALRHSYLHMFRVLRNGKWSVMWSTGIFAE